MKQQHNKIVYFEKNKKIIFCVFFFFAIYLSLFNTAQAQSDDSQFKTDKTINVDIFKDGDSYQINDLRVVILQRPFSNNYKIYKDNGYNGTIVSFNGSSLGFFPTNLSIKMCSDGRDPVTKKSKGTCVEMKKGKMLLQLPYFPNGKYADIYDLNGKKVLTIDLVSKATCNENGMCEQPKEDGANCPSDCTQKKPVGQKPVVEQAKPVATTPIFWQWAMSHLIAIITLIVITGSIMYIVVYLRRKNKQ